MGIDIAEASIADAKVRFCSSKARMNAYFDVADCFHSPLHIKADGSGAIHDPSEQSMAPFSFDIISCMFSFHYAFENESSVKMSLENVARHLKPGGIFIITIPKASIIEQLRDKAISTKSFPHITGNSLFEVEFDKHELVNRATDGDFSTIKYYFSLKEAVKRCPEFSVPMEVLFPMAASNGLIFESEMDFLKFFDDYRDNPEYLGLLNRFRLLERKTGDLCLSTEELETVGR